MNDSIEVSGKREQGGREEGLNFMEKKNTQETFLVIFSGNQMGDGCSDRLAAKSMGDGDQRIRKMSRVDVTPSAANLKSESPLRTLEGINADSTV